MEAKPAKDENQVPAESTPKIIYLTDEARARKIVKCPFCGSETSADATRCEHCGKSLETIDPQIEKGSENDDATDFDSMGYIKSALASKYEVLEEIATTSTSKIFRAIHIQLKKQVALKVLLRKIAQNHDYTERFHRRARAVDRLSQNNIISIYDEGVESGIHYVAMEFLKGTNLQDRIAKHGPLHPDAMVGILLPVVNGLGHAHRHGIVHGNLKCSSIFLHTDGRIILTGFGTPQMIKGEQLSFMRNPSSIQYLSPEEASGKGADGRSDIYSLGVVMYYSLTGKFPYSGTNPADTMNLIMNGIYTPPSKYRPVSQWLESIVDKCLQRDPSKRVQSCGELLWLLNSKPGLSSTQAKKVEEPTKPATPPVTPPVTEIHNEKKSNTEFVTEKQTATPAVTQQIDKQVPVEKPKGEFVESPEVTKHDTALPKIAVEPEPAKEPLPKNDQVLEGTKETKRKGHAVLWIAAVVAIIAFGVVITKIMTGNKSTSQSSVVNKPTEQIEQSAQGNLNEQASANQETEDQKVTQTPKSSTATQEAASSKEGTTTIRETPRERVATQKESPRSAATVSSSSGSESSKTEGTPAVVLVTVPDLTGTQLNVAKSILALNGLSVGTVTTIPDPQNDGMVVRQVPKPGTQLKKGSIVNIIMGSK
jgi:serine/threonine protein kinase